MIEAVVSAQGVLAKLGKLQQKLDGTVDDAAMDVGFEVLRLSQFEVPHDEGTLQNSGTVEQVEGDVVIGYHTKYAARLHEHPEYRFQKGRKGKYLEDPVQNNLDVFRKKFALKMGDGIERIIG